MNLQNITLISFGYFEKDFLEKTAEAVRLEFVCSANIREGHIDLSDFYDPGRRQYNGDKLLRQIDAMAFPDSVKVIGLFNIDLFIPILTFIYGQAFLGGRSGIASHYRLSNEPYGMVMDKKILLDRFRKEVIHELGHAFGLIHCYQPTCVMRSSTYVEDIDQKEQHLCLTCRTQLGV
ncbi:MAG: archaemetzincin family Zn-dependent metalloprotease [Bacteroidetes bacterium]|nr:archaemetzincin family Zn-dependent metalloprotease [Bacteroidota bacterium]